MNSSEDISNNESSQKISVIIIPALLSASTLLVVVIILWKTYHKKREKGGGSEDRTADYVDGTWAVNAAAVYENFPGISDAILEKKQLPSDWRIEDKVVLCSGHYGPISRAVLLRSGEAEDRRDVILKELSEHCSPGEVQDFVDLMKFYVQVCVHDKLVKMLWCQAQSRPLSLILEAMTLGNLLTFLRDSHQEARATQETVYRITEKDVCSMAAQVASGLEYLTGTHNLVHGYVAACNVLIHEDMSVRLCGLGLAAIQYRTGSVAAQRAARVPLKWQSPERLRGADITEKSDVWSFGILLYELITAGSPPYPALDPADVPQKLQKKYRMEQPQRCGDQLYQVMMDCWQWEAQKRPFLSDVVKQLQKALDTADGHTALTAVDTLSWGEYLLVAGISL
ncbi:tyrosine-protein kinase STYK1-like [Pseudophryne corroboree]|uniref:tyrosine-protein kinase STYK1-like n=1 Tax=Pseudophryne corroboree TaxID=495146 RepID=UPI0030814F54